MAENQDYADKLDRPRAQRAGWQDLACRRPFGLTWVREFGALTIPIGTKGNNLFEQNKARFNERKGAIIDKINAQVRFIK